MKQQALLRAASSAGRHSAEGSKEAAEIWSRHPQMSTGGCRQHFGLQTGGPFRTHGGDRLDIARRVAWRPGQHCRSKTSLVLCYTGRRSCAQHPFDTLPLPLSFCGLSVHDLLLARAVLAPPACVDRAQRRSVDWAGRARSQASKADCECESESACALVHALARSRSRSQPNL